MSNAFDFSDVDLSGFDPADIFNDAALPDFGSTAPPALDLGGVRSVFADIAGLVNVAYAGQAAVERGKLQNRIAAARLNNELVTVQSTPNQWLVLGLGAAAVGLFAFKLLDRDK